VTYDHTDQQQSVVDNIIRQRKTAKTLSDPAGCADLPDDLSQVVHQTLNEIIEVAGWAPFHKVANENEHRRDGMSSPVPWRFYTLEKPACCRLVRFIEQQAADHPDSKWTKAASSKIPRLLAGCSATVLVTWLPDPSANGAAPELTENNIEHIAAASAAVQNLLLAAQARGWHNYWSSGGILKDADTFAYLGIPGNQMLLGAIFLAHPDQPHEENQPGGLRDKRGAPETWSRWLRLD